MAQIRFRKMHGLGNDFVVLDQRGDAITIDADAKLLQVNLDDAELARRRKAWVRPEPREARGVLAKYARTVRSASEGAVTT
jgi:dihydroxy-acid dehydratase